MKYRVRKLVDEYTEVLSAWPEVECVALNEAALPDVLDPYFAVILDVYHRGNIPAPEARRQAYGAQASLFETSFQRNKDRFLVGDLPVRIEYKNTRQVEELVDLADSRREGLWLIKDSGTYGYYRLAYGEVRFSRSGWIEGLRQRLFNLDDDFWARMRDASQSKMEHFLADLGAAALQGDDFFSLMSASGFLKFACLSLFAVNHRFEPSHRGYAKQLRDLKKLPTTFAAQFENFFQQGQGMTQQYSLAQLMAKSILAL